MTQVGSGEYEIRIREQGQAHRIFYVANFEGAVYVLDAFEKKTQRTATSDFLNANPGRHLLETRQWLTN